jgi:hypothetical protein
VIGHRSAAVLSCSLARRRVDAIVKTDEAKALPGVVSALSALLETLENVLADGADRPVVQGAVRTILELSPSVLIALDAAAGRRQVSRETLIALALSTLEAK